VAISRASRTAVQGHRVMHVTLSNGAHLDISAGHPTADGRSFGELHAGDLLDGLGVESVQSIPYPHSFTYDILPDSDTGTYVAGGALIRSTLVPASDKTAACFGSAVVAAWTVD
jgi:hypothetical protein